MTRKKEKVQFTNIYLDETPRKNQTMYHTCYVIFLVLAKKLLTNAKARCTYEEKHIINNNTFQREVLHNGGLTPTRQIASHENREKYS